MTFRKNILLVSVFVLACVLTREIHAQTRDVALIYDFSGSMNQQRREAMDAANNAITALLTDGVRPPEKTWLVSVSPGSDALFQGANVQGGSRVIFLAFNQPQRCEVPFFSSTPATIGALEDAPQVIRRLLPVPAKVIFKDWTYLELAKWQAVEELERPGKNPGPWLFVIVSDFIKDMERGPCSKAPIAMEKIQEYNTQYDEQTLLQANWRASQSTVSLLGFRIYKVAVKAAPSTPPPKTSPKAPENPQTERSPPAKPTEPSVPLGWGFLWVALIGAAILIAYLALSRFGRRGRS